MFPSNWDPTHVTGKRRKRTFLEETDQCVQQCMPQVGCPLPSLPLHLADRAPLPQVPFQSDLHHSIMRRLNTSDAPAQEGPPPAATMMMMSASLNLDHILARVPYKSMLENLFSSASLTDTAPDVPILTRAYEESFMRHPHPGEQACVMGDVCECQFIDKNAPFVGVELRQQNDPETPQMCVLCSRATTQKCFYDMCFLGKPMKGVIQRYGSIFGQPGEYAQEVMIIPPRAMGLANMPLPTVSHQRNRYSVVTHGGVKHLRQHRVGYEDFQRPSSTAAV
jgi:hypothetical protein